MKSETNLEQTNSPSPEAMESLSRQGITITSSERTPGGIWLHKGVVQPGATIFSRVPRPDKDA